MNITRNLKTQMCAHPNVPKEMRTPEMETKARQYFAAVYGLDLQFGRLPVPAGKWPGRKHHRGTVCQSWRDNGISQQDEQEHLV